VAIVGSGPAGFYTAHKVMRDIPGTKIDMYEQLPVPFGLVRFGVAPDHPEVKNCQDTFQELAASPNYTFIGNVNLGYDIPLSLLAKHYDSIVFAYGASKDRRLGLDGEEKPHVYSARAFVGWYNGLPEYRNLDPGLGAGDTAIVVGQGNVALDVARTLLSKIEVLQKTDITEYALQALASSKIKHVHVVGRRGPLQAAFTIKEVRELLHLEDVNFTPISPDLLPSDLSKLPRPKKRIMELLKKGSPPRPKANKSWSLDFLMSPKALKWSDSNADQLEGVEFQKNRLDDPMSPESKITATNQSSIIPASTLFRSIGYKAEAIPGMHDIGADFNEQRGTIHHDGYGRIIPLQKAPTLKHPEKASLYCSGWVKRGPTGVIASTMTDAFQTAEAIIEDWKKRYVDSNMGSSAQGWTAVQSDASAQVLKLKPVHWDNWKSIDEVEKIEGTSKGKPREKLGTVEEMLRASKIEI
jgi:adrenodoxin-NADP+ reductase